MSITRIPIPTGVSKPFFCHQCDRTVNIVVIPTDDPLCPLCHEGFLEEYENPNPTQNSNPISDPMISSDRFSSFLPFPFLFPSSGDLQNPVRSQVRSGTRSGSLETAGFDSLTFLQNHLQNLNSGGARIQFVIENHPSNQGFGLPSNLGDYFVGQGLEQLIQQLAENDPNRYGTPPASKTAVCSLPTVKVTDEFLNTEMNQCAVCMDKFDQGAEAKQMPCKHLYHKDCIFPWLELHNSCPVCRFELPTDDQDYERKRVEGSQRSSGSGGGGGGGGGGRGGAEFPESGSENQAAERSFRISFPWPFRTHGSSSDGGASQEPRQEDMD